MKKMNSFIHGKNSYRAVFGIFLLACCIIGGFCFQYYNQLQAAIKGESRGYLQEIARRIGNNIDNIIDTNYAALNTIASIMQNYETDSFADVKPIVQTQQQYWNYLDVMLIDESGKAYNSEGTKVSLDNDAYFHSAVIDKKQGISTTQMINNQECILFVVPLEDMVIGGKNMVAMAASYDPATFDQTLSMSSFSGQAYSCIISNAGTVVVRSSAQNSIKFGYNVLSTIEESKMDSGDNISQVKTGMAANQEGQIGFTQNGIRYYMVYSPLTPENWYLTTFVPANVVNERSDMLLRITLVLCGVISAAFAGLIAFLMYSSYRNKIKLEQIAYVDDVTGGNTIQKFYELAQEALDVPDRPPYVLVYTNLQKFKVLNEQFGRRACDIILQQFSDIVNSSLKNRECMGRVTADNFCILLQYESEAVLLKRFSAWYNQGEAYVDDNKPAWSLPITEFGVYLIDNDSIPFPQIIDRAKLTLRDYSKSITSKLRYAIYDDGVHDRLFREKHLEDMMENALKQGEFQVYLQPKYRPKTKTIGGAEALTRWVSATEGMIFPDEFIPLFEKNGFIVQLDLWIFEEVCKKQRYWLDKGLEPVKISVNCSRVQLKNNDFLKAYQKISDRYNLPYGLIEIELTESVVMEDSQRLVKIIDDIHSSGFGCSMDDFGSGYSSLNLIQTIPVDTLKLDKIFFRSSSKDSSRMESVVSSIITMAKALSMETVAEGVEYPEQVEMLQRIGCDYIQGYVFAKPMPVPAFEELAFGIGKE